MAPPVSFTKATLSYPVYAAEFDPYNRGYLVVGGGGGEGRSGVSNKLTLLDATSRSSLEVAAEIELSRDEDSVTSLASLASKDGLISLAGINSSEADQKAGKNEHLRAFEVRYPKRRRKDDSSDEKDNVKNEDGKISLIGKSSLFKPATGPKPEQYQRVLKLSPARKSPSANKRIGAIATGLSKDPQLVIFDATRTPAKQSEIISTIDLDGEAADLDIINTGSQDFALTWCTDFSIYEQSVSYDFSSRKKELTPKGPRNLHTIPQEDAEGKAKVRPKYRSVRFLTDHHILILSNLPNKTGADLSILHLYPTGPGAILFHKVLPSHIKQAVAMDVCALNVDDIGSGQFVIAVAGQDISLEIYTINYTRQSDTFTPFKSFTTLRDVHPLQMTSLRFAPFFPPANPASSKEQVIKLASTSMGNTVVVDTFTIQPLDATKKSPHVLSHPSDERWTTLSYTALISVIVLVSAVLLQSLFFPEQGQALVAKLPSPIRSIFDPSLGKSAASLGENVRAAGGRIEEVEAAASIKLRDWLKRHPAAEGSHKQTIVLRKEGEDSANMHLEHVDDKEAYLQQNAHAKHWDDLEEHEKHKWRQALIDAGQWSANEGETVLKGVLFSSYAGLVGQLAGEAIRGL